MTIFQSILLFFTSFLLMLQPTPKYSEGTIGQPVAFLPSKAVSHHEKTVSHLIYRGLFKYDIYGVLIPDLADTWTVSSDGLVYTLKLKDNQYWTDGRKITADDLIYSSFKLEDLSGVATDKVDDLTVRFILPNKYAPFLSLLTVGVMQVNSEEKGNQLMPVSSGDFGVVNVEKAGGIVRKVTLATPKQAYQIRKIEFRYYSSEEELVTAAKLGEIDGFLAKDEHKLVNLDNYRFPLQGIYYALFFNLDNTTLKDVELRKKLEKTLNMEDIVAGRGIQVEGPISRSVFTNNSLAFSKYDKAYAENIPQTTLILTVPNIEAHVELAKEIKEMWEDKLGITVTVRKIPPEEIVNNVIKTKDFEILLYGQEVGRDPDRYVNWHSTQKDFPGLNISGFSQVKADRALEEGRNELDNEKRIVHYNEFQKVVSENVPAIFLYHPFVNFYVSDYIKGIGEKYTFNYYDRFLDFYNWKRVVTN